MRQDTVRRDRWGPAADAVTAKAPGSDAFWARPGRAGRGETKLRFGEALCLRRRALAPQRVPGLHGEVQMRQDAMDHRRILDRHEDRHPPATAIYEEARRRYLGREIEFLSCAPLAQRRPEALHPSSVVAQLLAQRAGAVG